MSADKTPPSDDKEIKPITKNDELPEVLSGIGNHKPLDVPRVSEDLLEELRRKTSELAKEIKGKDEKKSQVLELDGMTKEEREALQDLKLPKTKLDKSQKANPATGGKLDDSNPAVALVREKLSRIYKKEPSAEEEALEAYEAGNNRSKHQQFMYDLTTSGKSLADIQTQWHKYYVDLPESEKHEVWQEFYSAQREHSHLDTRSGSAEHKKDSAQPKKRKVPAPPPAVHSPSDNKTVGAIKAQLMDKISAGGKLNAVHHVKSLLFGIGLSAMVLVLVSFVFFNEAYIAPFINPGRSVSATPIIGANTGVVGPESKIIIPKINLEVPVVFGLNSIGEGDIQNALEDGVVHYSSTPSPGEIGNSVIVGHSSNNILNSGKYKFAFVLLKRLEAEDTFFVQKDGIRYTYKVYKKEVVKPNNVSVLNTQDRPNTMTLITCDPPGTSINRLIITAEQISPDPSGNTESTSPTLEATEEEDKLPSNAPSLWSRIWPF